MTAARSTVQQAVLRAHTQQGFVQAAHLQYRKRLLYVCPDVLHALQPAAEPDQVILDAILRPLLWSLQGEGISTKRTTSLGLSGLVQASCARAEASAAWLRSAYQPTA